MIYESRTQECVGIGESACMTVGRTKIKITLDGSQVYYFDDWVGGQVGQEAILRIDFMVPTGIRWIWPTDPVSTSRSSHLFGWAETATSIQGIGDQPQRSTHCHPCR